MRGFPWQIVAAVDSAMLVTSNEHRGMVRSAAGLERVLRAIQRDRGSADLGFRRQAVLQRREDWVTEAVPK